MLKYYQMFYNTKNISIIFLQTDFHYQIFLRINLNKDTKTKSTTRNHNQSEQNFSSNIANDKLQTGHAYKYYKIISIFFTIHVTVIV